MIAELLNSSVALPSTSFRRVCPQDFHSHSFTHPFKSLFDKYLSNLCYAFNDGPGTNPRVWDTSDMQTGNDPCLGDS